MEFDAILTTGDKYAPLPVSVVLDLLARLIGVESGWSVSK